MATIKPKKERTSATVKRLRELLETFPDKKMFSIYENSYDVILCCVRDDHELRRAYMKWDLLRVKAQEFREILDNMKNA